MRDSVATPHRTRRARPMAIMAASLTVLWGLAAAAQGFAPNTPATLPDAPSAAAAQPSVSQPSVSSSRAWIITQPAPKNTKYIRPGAQAVPLDAGGKIDLTLHDLYSPESFVSFFAAAGYSQLVNGQPNYGVDKGAFGERLGAAAIRDTSQNVFTGAVFAPLLHEDPRLYVEGNGYSFIHRTAYAVTRPLITRSDSGHSRINGSLLLGYAAAAALTNAYYPQVDRTGKSTAKTYGASVGGAALGDFFHEFIDDALESVHLEKRQER